MSRAEVEFDGGEEEVTRHRCLVTLWGGGVVLLNHTLQMIPKIAGKNAAGIFSILKPVKDSYY